MKMYDGTNFISNIGGFARVNLHLEMYVNNDYECACGEVHTFDYDSEILCQGAWKLVLECPNNKEYITCVKLKSKFLGMGFAGFDSLFGTKLLKNKTNDFDNIDMDNLDPYDMPEEISNSYFMFHYIIKKHIGDI
jgi:hypothetical protein